MGSGASSSWWSGEGLFRASAEPVPAAPPVLCRSIPARPEELAGLRAAARSWLADQGVDAAGATDVLLALAEASANAVEHAYGPEGEGMVDVVLRRDGDDVRVTVRDHGRWRPPPAATDRGRGTGIMEAVSTAFDRRHDAAGTVVELTVPVPGGR